MGFVRRIAALVMGILVIQLALAAGSTQCDEPAAATEAAHAAMSMPAESESCSSDAAGADCAPTDHSACQAVMSCMSAVFKPAAQSQLAMSIASAGSPTERSTTLQTRTTVPDLPPPRA